MTWDGKPQNPERDGWHFIQHDDEICVAQWRAIDGYWFMCGSVSQGEMGANCTYLGPCLTPAEVAARCEDAARAEREAAARVCDARSIGWAELGGMNTQVARENEAGMCAAAIRARGEPQR